jgi:aldose 1-epimerase
MVTLLGDHETATGAWSRKNVTMPPLWLGVGVAHMVSRRLLGCLVLAVAAACLAAAASGGTGAVTVSGGAVTGSGSVTGTAAGGSQMNVEKSDFGKMPDGRAIDLYTLTGPKGMRVRVITYGAILVSVEAPDKAGKVADVTLGFEKVDDWITNQGSFGSSIGRYANRIGGAKITLDGTTYNLTANMGQHQIHGGNEGFHKKLWTAQAVKTDDAVGVRLTYVSKDGEEGFPGTLTATATYSLTKTGDLKLEYGATTDKPTVVNLVNHVYWNLGGPGTPDCLGHILQINADEFTVPSPENIPTGEIKPVKDTPLDFTKPKAIGANINETASGYDHNLVIRGKDGEVRLAAKAVDPKSGRVMEVLTDQPGVQFYTMNWGGPSGGKGGQAYGPRAGFCLETQHYPDSPNHDNFPTTVLKPGQTYKVTTIFRFSTE